MGHINRFVIRGLHGRLDVSIDIRDNCIILVGANGLGKTTIINLLYYFLTEQWVRLCEYTFAEIGIQVDGKDLVLQRDKIDKGVERLSRRLGRHRVSHVGGRTSEQIILEAMNAEGPLDLRAVARKHGVPLHWLESVRLDDFARQEFLRDSELREFGEELRNLLPERFVYLPTYRRIERDLEKIFPGLDPDLWRRTLAAHERDSRAFLEFVEFGMRDVEQVLANRASVLKDRARKELNDLAASYLGEVIKGEAELYDVEMIASLEEEELDKIISRVERRDFLQSIDRNRLRSVIETLKRPDASKSPSDKYVGHFIAKLAAIHRSLVEAESSINALTQVCNGYLFGKKLVFDENSYSIKMRQDAGDKELELERLSSGEKQVVSLFTHIFLGEKRFGVLIDEPELSLSVLWQRKLLPDIRQSGRCTLLVAVTHSPFIFDNELMGYATDLSQCITEG